MVQACRVSYVTLLTCHRQSLGLQRPLCHCRWPSSQGHLGSVPASLQAPWAAAGGTGTHGSIAQASAELLGQAQNTSKAKAHAPCLGAGRPHLRSAKPRYGLAVVWHLLPRLQGTPKACQSGNTLNRCICPVDSLGLWRRLQPMQQQPQEALEAAAPPAGQLAPLAGASADSPAFPCCQAPGQRCHLQQQQVG